MALSDVPFLSDVGEIENVVEESLNFGDSTLTEEDQVLELKGNKARLKKNAAKRQIRRLGLPQAIRLNLMNEFTEVDIFIISMDSLLVQMMQHDYLSWILGGQSLVVVYMLESFLKSLKDKGGQFQLIWFDDLEICFEENSTALLMREIVKKHFVSIPSLKENIFNFPSPFLPSWAKFVKQLSPSFLFCSDGTLNNNKFPGFKSDMFKESIKSLIVRCLSMNVATFTFDGIQQNEATFFAYCYKPNKNLSTVLPPKIWKEMKSLAATKDSIFQSTEQNVLPVIDSSRFWAAVVKKFLEKNDDCRIVYDAHCTTFLKAVNFQQSVTLELRAQTFNISEKKLKEAETFIQGVCLIAAHFLHCLLEPVPFPVHDLIDGRFFAYFLTLENGGSEIKCKSTKTSKQLGLTEQLPSSSFAMQPLNHQLFDMYATDIVKAINASLDTTGQSHTNINDHLLFLEHRHWHSGKLIKDDFSEKVKEKWTLRKGRNFNEMNKYQSSQNLKNWFDFYGESLEGRTQKVSFHPPKKNVDRKLSKQCIDKYQFKKVESLPEKDKIKAASNRFQMPCTVTEADGKAEDLFNQVLCLQQQILDRKEQDLEKRRKICVDLFLTLDELLHKELDGKKIFHFLNKKEQNKVEQIWLDIGIRSKMSNHLKGLRSSDNLFLDIDICEYRLAFVGNSIEVQSDPVPDIRVEGFVPDGWQRELLDIVDDYQSALIIAPTSAGKTFISYYCIEKVLQDTPDGIVVYVSPTKALVNQVAATINDRFKHIVLSSKEQALFGIFTRDIRKDVHSCRILVTVPQCLEILFLSPQTQLWCKNLKYAIFDEVHCIGGMGDILGSEVWEHIILLTPCPFLALSATVGNVNVLHNWLNYSVQLKTSGRREVKLVQYDERYSELKLFLYNIFDKNSKKRLIELHPLAVCNREMIRRFGVPADLQLTAKQIFNLWKAIKEMKRDVGRALKPKAFFGSKHFLLRDDIRKYEDVLKQEFGLLLLEMDEGNPIGDSTVNEQLTKRAEAFDEQNMAMKGIVDVILDLQKRKMFPCLCFSDNRLLCENFAENLLNYLSRIDEQFKLQQNEKEDSNRQQEKMVWNKVTSKGNKLKAQSSLANFKGNNDQYQEVIGRLKHQELSLPSTIFLLKCFERGIGYHHSGMTIAQKQSVEILFRSGYLQVVFATATLALGIHMPCKTVILVIDSPYLTPLQYRQMIGRAGRRGFDKNGNVILFSISTKKITRLLTAPLPSLRPNVPFTVSYILRLLSLVANVDQEEQTSSLQEMLALLQQPFIVQTLTAHQEKLQTQLEHYFVFACHFLNRIHLINSTLQPIGPAGIVTHLAYHEPGNFIFTYFLQQGAFHKLCEKYYDNELKLNEILVLIISHLFTNTIGFIGTKCRLEPMPMVFISLLKKYNKEVCHFYISFLTYVAEHLFPVLESSDGSSPLLPYSGEEISRPTFLNESEENETILQNLQNSKLMNVKIGGPVYSITGQVDSQLDLLNLKLVYPLRDGIYYDRGFVPAGLNLQENHRGQPIYLNSYALDFFRNESINELVNENKIMIGDAFNLVYDFCLVLKSIAVSLEELGPSEDIVVQTFGKLSNIYFQKFQKVQFSQFTKCL